MHTAVSHGNANPNRTMLAFHFLRALARIRRGTAKQSSTSPGAVVRRGWRIRRAAYASMALAAGPRRVWSRTILRRLRGCAGVWVPADRRAAAKRNKIRVGHRKPKEGDGSQEEALRRLVPGGRGMEYCRLLEEMGDYIQCLQAQVLLMQRMAGSNSR